MTTRLHVTLRVMTALLGVAVVFSMMHLYALLTPANALALLNVQDLVSTSATSAAANHTITFDLAATSAGIANDDSEAIVIEFDNETPDAFDLTGLAIADVDLSINSGADESMAADCTGAENWGVVFNIGTPDTLTLTACTDGPGLSASDNVEIEIGTHSASGVTDIDNPGTSGTSYPITITLDDDGTLGAGEIDEGETRVMILDQVTMSAKIDTNLDCTVTGHVEDTGSVLGVTTDTTGPDCGFGNDGTISATVMDFDYVCPDDGDQLDREFIGQSLTVTTNATNGFLWTVEQDQNLQSATGDDIDLFIDGAATATPVDWASPTGTLAFGEAGYGHYGILSDDTNLETDTAGGDPDDFNDDTNATCTASPCFAGNIAAARNIFASSGPADGTTADVGQADWGVAIEVSSLQEAATDYTNTLTHICTPTF